MIVRRKYDMALVGAFALALFAYASIRPQFALQPEMPPEFVSAPLLPAPKRAAEQSRARAYWHCAVSQIQWKYRYGTSLPKEPPEEFRISDGLPGASETAERLRYWKRVQEVWLLPSVWNKQYTLDFQWVVQAIQVAAEWLGSQVRSVLRLI